MPQDVPEREAAARVNRHAAFLFHQRSNGKLAEDRRGRQFGSVDEACTYAIHRTPAILGKTLRSATNTYLSTEVFDGKRSICVVRATVIIERR